MSAVPIIATTKNNEELATHITSILKGLGKPNVDKHFIKGGAPDDGLAKLIVSVLKALSNKDKNKGTDAKSSMFGSKLTIKGDPTDSLIIDILDIILNLSQNVPLSKPKFNLKDDAMLAIRSTWSSLSKFIPSARDPTIHEEEVFVRNDKENQDCIEANKGNPVASMNDDCAYDNQPSNND